MCTAFCPLNPPLLLFAPLHGAPVEAMIIISVKGRESESDGNIVVEHCFARFRTIVKQEVYKRNRVYFFGTAY